jgi:hypothetical protein
MQVHGKSTKHGNELALKVLQEVEEAVEDEPWEASEQ